MNYCKMINKFQTINSSFKNAVSSLEINECKHVKNRNSGHISDPINKAIYKYKSPKFSTNPRFLPTHVFYSSQTSSQITSFPET